MRSSKALEALDLIPDDEFERPEAPGPMQIDDRALVAALRSDLAALSRAVASIKSPDMEPVCEALKSMAASQKSLASAMTAPRVLTFDKNGEPTGLRIEG